jgi:hypothetical protein
MHADDRTSTLASETEHLSEDQLLEICFPVTNGQHLAACEPCRSRYDELVSALDAIREEGAQEADAVFTPERLAAQREAILRRIERTPHSADVVAFPGHRAARPGAWRAVPSKRWVAAAAAAGLVAGLAMGRYTGIRSHSSGATPSSAVASVTPRRVQPPYAAAQPAEERFLVEIEDAVLLRRVVELQALDALTSPELREISLDGSR